MSNRRKNRIFAVQFAYSWATNLSREPAKIEDLVGDFSKTYFKGEENQYNFGKLLSRGIIENVDIIDDLIKKHAIHWSLDRIAMVDLAILRVAVYEMVFCEDVPPVVAMNEAIEIGKIMSTNDSGRFLNGVLEGIKGELTRPLR